MEKTIEKLKSDKHYYGKFGKKFLSNSDIYDLLHNPKEFQQPKEANINFEFGKAFHEVTHPIGATRFTKSIQVNRMRLQIIQLADG